MSNFIKLTNIEGGKSLVNLDAVLMMWPFDHNDPKAGITLELANGTRFRAMETFRTISGRLGITSRPSKSKTGNNPDTNTNNEEDN